MRHGFRALALVFACSVASAQDTPVLFEAESGTRGTELIAATDGTVQYLTAGTNGTGESPGSSERVVTYTVTFPGPGTYELFARIRVGPAEADDDSLFYGNGFGPKSAGAPDDWILANGLSGAGYTLAGDQVIGNGTAGAGVWKWVNLSSFTGGETPIRFSVGAGALTQTLVIAAREDGLQMDKFAFGRQGVTFTVANLDGGTAGSTDPIPEPYVPSGPPLATGRAKFLGSSHAAGATQSVHFERYWNQLTPENAGKWGSIEATRDVMNWQSLDASYALAKANGIPFKMHTLIWGAQQPSWIESLSPAEQRAEIEEWFAAVAARYPELEMIDVVNEPINDPPDRPGNGGGNYLPALGGAGATGWDWVLTAFRLARDHFPRSKLILNEYSVTNSSTRAASYVQIISLLKAEGLIDGVGIQAHAFETTVPAATTKANLDTIAAAGIPIYISELDIDGPSDAIQLDAYQRIFPVFWEHPAVVGITLWGYRPGLWRTAQGAYLVLENGAERAAMRWLKDYIAASPAGGPLMWSEPRSQQVATGREVTFSPWTTGATAYQWERNGLPLPGATQAVLTIPSVALADAGTYQLVLTGPGGVTRSAEAVLAPYPPGLSKLVNLSTRSLVGTGSNVQIAGFIVGGAGAKRILLRASGPALAQLGATGVLPDPVLELYRGSTVIQANDDWSAESADRNAIRDAATTVQAFPWAEGSKDAALIATLPPGPYTAIVSGKAGATGVALVEAYEIDGEESRLVNISTRSLVGTGGDVQIAGFVIGGDGPKRVAIRASGPSLAQYGLGGLLADPVLEIYRGSVRLAANDNWPGALQPDFDQLGVGEVWSRGSKDAALILVLEPGGYTAIVSGSGGASGVALVEVYPLD